MSRFKLNKIFKKLSRIILASILLILFLIGSGIIMGSIYKDRISEYLITELNKELNVKLIVGEMDFSVIRKFPFASLVLNNVAALPADDFNRKEFPPEFRDTLFSASKIFLQFNLPDIFVNRFSVKRVHAVGGKVNLLTDATGNVNFRIFKTEGKSKDPLDLTLNLEKVKISSFDWYVRNFSKNIVSSGTLKDLSLRGEFYSGNFSLSAIGSLYIHNFSRDGVLYGSRLNTSASVLMEVTDSLFTLKKGQVIIENNILNASGFFITGEKSEINLSAGSDNLDIASVGKVLPFIRDKLKEYAPEGKADILVSVKGKLSSTYVPSIRAAFKIRSARINLPSGLSPLTEINLQGTYSNGKHRNAASNRVELKGISLMYQDNKLSGNLRIESFISPLFTISLKGAMRADMISDLITYKGLILDQGMVYPDILAKVSFRSFNDLSINGIKESSMAGTVGFKDIKGNIPMIDLPLDQLDGFLYLDGNKWRQDFTAKFGPNIFSAKLSSVNLFDCLLQDSILPVIRGEIYSPFCSIPDFLDQNETDQSSGIQFPDSIDLKFYLMVDELVYGKFNARDFETVFSYKFPEYSFQDIRFKTMSGYTTGAGILSKDVNGQIILQSKSVLRKIDINHLFTTFNDFGQSFLKAENLKGSLSGTVDFSCGLTPGFDFILPGLSSDATILIENGELIEFEPITKLSSFVSLSELQHITFSTLKNSVMIRDEKILIPEMDIQSSAFNITISGSHSFNNEFDYKVKLALSEILAGKARKAKAENDEFGVIEEDGTGRTSLYLSITGNPDDYKIRYDRKEAVNKLRKDLKTEKESLKSILNEEFGWFSKDTVTKSPKEERRAKDKFILDWEENKKENIPEKQNTFEITWEEEESEL